MIATACSRFQTLPLWKQGIVSSTLRNGIARKTYSSLAVLVTAKRPHQQSPEHTGCETDAGRDPFHKAADDRGKSPVKRVMIA